MGDSSLLRKDNIRGSYKKEELSDDELADAYEKVRAKYRKQGVYLPDNKMKIDVDSLSWKTPHFSKIPPEVAYQEVERIKAKHNGLLTAEILLDESRNTNAVFHSCFNWDDAEAADLFRVQQARHLIKNISLVVLSNGEPKQVRVYEIVKKVEGKVYKSIDTFDTADVDYIRSQVVKALMQYRNKLSVYDQFSKAVKHVDNAISELEVLELKKQEAA